MSEINTPCGLRISTYEQPPADFNVLTASQKSLRDFGIPSRPNKKTSPKYYALWKHMFSRKMTYIVPTFSRLEGITHGPRLSKEAMSAESALNWSGLVAYAPASSSFGAISSRWNIPNLMQVPETPSIASYYASQWIGIDGDGGSKDILQAGTETNIGRDRLGNVSFQYYPWWEWFPEAPYMIDNLPIAPGVMIECSVGALSATSGSVYMANMNENVAISFNITAPAGWALVGNCAEWIVERPCVNSHFFPLPNYTTVFFDHSNAVYMTNDVVTDVSLGSATAVTMTDGTPRALSIPQYESDTLAKIDWIYYGESQDCPT